MEVPWKMCNALRLTANFETISWNKKHFYRVGDIIYFAGKSELDCEGTRMLYVYFWEIHHTEASDIPEEFWVSANFLERALDIKDREVCNYNIDFNTNKRFSLS